MGRYPRQAWQTFFRCRQSCLLFLYNAERKVGPGEERRAVSSTSTAIEWTDATWNPVTGCSKVSEGCRNCYAAALAPRLAAMGQDGYTDLRWTKPRRIFVNSMSDLFHELVPFEFVDRVFAVMALAPRHTFQVLTKRPERMAEYFERLDARALHIEAAMGEIRTGIPPAKLGTIHPPTLPLPNVWLGTSV